MGQGLKDEAHNFSKQFDIITHLQKQFCCVADLFFCPTFIEHPSNMESFGKGKEPEGSGKL